MQPQPSWFQGGTAEGNGDESTGLRAADLQSQRRSGLKTLGKGRL
jgi:hypothetical protein